MNRQQHRSHRPSLRQLWRWLERGLYACGAVCLLLVAGTLLEGLVYQTLARQELENLETTPVQYAEGLTVLPPLEPGTPLGTIRIPEAGVDAAILEGVDGVTLRRGVGHFPATRQPGSPGNFALAAHRDTFFRGLRHLEVGQLVEITTPEGEFRYRIESTRVVEPDAVEVLEDGEGTTLTLITCHPFNYIGPAPRRFVASGRLEEGHHDDDQP